MHVFIFLQYTKYMKPFMLLAWYLCLLNGWTLENMRVVCFLTKNENINTELWVQDNRWKREKAAECFGHSPFIPSAFSPAFSSCSLTTSFMCCHWGSPSPISWTLTSPSGLLPVLYLVILILTWSSAAWSGGGWRDKRGTNNTVHLKTQQAGPQEGGGKSQDCGIGNTFL